jgi:hypothetical protein
MANRFWVGGSGTWDGASTANWSATTGGASGASAPVAADNIFFDANSGSGTCTTAAGATGTACTVNSTTLGLTLGANLTLSGTLTFTQNTLNINDKTLTCRVFTSSNTNTRSIAFGTGNLTITGNGGAIVDMDTGTNFSATGTPVMNFTYSGSTGTRTIILGTGITEANTINVNISAGSDIITLYYRTKNLNFTGFTGTVTNVVGITLYGDLTLSSGMTITPTAFGYTFNAQNISTVQKVTSNNITITNPVNFSLIGTVQLQDNLTLSSTLAATLTAGTLDLKNNTLSTGRFASSNANTRTLIFGTGNITTTGSGTVWNTGTPTNFVYTGTPTVNISNNSATATTVSTGTMTAAQALNFNYTTGTYTLTDTAAVYKTVNFTGFAGTIPNSVRTIHGGATFSAGMTLTAGANATTFAAISGTNNITTAAKTLDFPITFNGIGGTWAFQDALTQGSTRAFTITNGTVQLKSSATSTTGAFATSGTNQKFLQSTTPGTQATLTQASGTVNASYLTIKDITATGGATWNALWSNNNVDLGGNSGWVFGDPPIINAVEYTYALRSFTQPRRF